MAGSLRAKLDEVSSDVDSFLSKVRGEVEATKVELEKFGPDVFIELERIPAEIEGAKEELGEEIDALLQRIEQMKE